MIDIQSEELVPLGKASNQWIRTRPHISTVWRWTQRGINGHKLDTVRVGGRTYTSREAVERFLSAINGLNSISQTQSKQREREIAAAEARLGAVGVK